MRSKIIKNAAKCAHCGAVLVSEHVHDFKSHRCAGGYFFVDGGREYLRRGFDKLGDFVELSEFDASPREDAAHG